MQITLHRSDIHHGHSRGSQMSFRGLDDVLKSRAVTRETVKEHGCLLPAKQIEGDVFYPRTAHAREAVGQHAAPQVFGDLSLDVTGQSATFGIGRAYLGEHRLRVPRDELVSVPTSISSLLRSLLFGGAVKHLDMH
jgi:hypothetical protein